MSNQLIHSDIHSDCESCFGLCCVALPYAKSADFAFDKGGGTPCPNLQSDYRCGIHKNLRGEGFKGCSVYECFGAGQKVSQFTYEGEDWRKNPHLAEEMYNVFPVMQQLHEMLYYLYEAIQLKETLPIHAEIKVVLQETEKLTNLGPKLILELDIPSHREKVNEVLLQTSELVRAKISRKNRENNNRDFIGATLKNANFNGSNLRGALFIAADLRNAGIRGADVIGADFRDADLSGADLTGSIFLTQAQVNAAKGDIHTKLPTTIRMPNHWK